MVRVQGWVGSGGSRGGWVEGGGGLGMGGYGRTGSRGGLEGVGRGGGGLGGGWVWEVTSRGLLGRGWWRYRSQEVKGPRGSRVRVEVVRGEGSLGWCGIKR